MLRSSDLIVHHLDGAEWALIEEMSKRSSIGGRSNFRTGNRMATLMDDQKVGHAVGYAATCHLFGDPRKYIQARQEADSHPFFGDGGVDLLGSNIDFKGTRWGGKHPFERVFLVSEREYGAHKVYIFGMARLYRTCCDVCLVGHIPGEELLCTSDGHPPDQYFFGSHRTISIGFRGRYATAEQLYPLPKFEWRKSC